MSASRENAPLVEIIAEMRWDSAPSAETHIGMGLGPTLISNTSAIEGFFMRMGAAAQALSHSETERLVPGGFPIIMHQPIYRFRRSEAGQPQTLYQVGPGLFSANAVPPYESWNSFRPIVRAGVEALLKNRNADEATSPFNAMSLRYIDAFTSHHTQGMDVGRFITEILGIQVSVPSALSRHIRPDSTIKPMIQLHIPMNDGLVMSVGIGEGMVNSQPAIMMDTSVSTTLQVPATVEAAMAVFELAHEAIDASFTEMIKPINHLMPTKAE